MKRALVLLLLPVAAWGQTPQGTVSTSGTLGTNFSATVSNSPTPINLAYDWDEGDPPEGCGQSSPATYNITQGGSATSVRFESHYGDVGQNDSCSANPLHVRTEVGTVYNSWPLNPASQDIWKSYTFMLEQPTNCTTLVSGQCLISSQYTVVGQLHNGNSTNYPSGSSPAFDFDMPACLNEATPTSIGVCPSGPYGSNFQIVVRQCETSLTTCASLPSPVFVYTMPSFVFGQYYSITWHAVYSQAGYMLNSDGTVSSTGYFPGGTSCANVTCGQLQVWINGVEVVNYTGIVLGYPENVAYGGSCPTSNPTTIQCPYDKTGIYRQFPVNHETLVAHYNTVQYGNAQICLQVGSSLLSISGKPFCTVN